MRYIDSLSSRLVLVLCAIAAFSCTKEEAGSMAPCESFEVEALYDQYDGQGISSEEVLLAMQGTWIVDTCISERGVCEKIVPEEYLVVSGQSIYYYNLEGILIRKVDFGLVQNNSNVRAPYEIEPINMESEVNLSGSTSGWVIPCASWIIFSTLYWDGFAYFYRPYSPQG